MKSRRKFARYRLPPFIWAAVIFVESSIPGTKLPSTPSGTDKMVHIVIFFILAWLTFRALSHETPPVISTMSLFLTEIVTILYGFADEFHQLYVPGRSADVFDMAADAVGGFLFLAVWLLLRFRRREREAGPNS